MANQSTFGSLDNSCHESPFRLVSWQAVLQECDDELMEEDETATAAASSYASQGHGMNPQSAPLNDSCLLKLNFPSTAQNSARSSSFKTPQVRFSLPQTFFAPAGSDLDSLYASHFGSDSLQLNPAQT